MKPVRPHMGLQVKLEAALIALNLDPADVEFHHAPSLALRPYDATTGEWTPDANDPRYIIPMATAAHRERTPADTTAAAKVKRVTKAHELHIATVATKLSGDDLPRDVKRHRIPNRGFDKRHRPMNWRKPTSPSHPIEDR